MFNTNDERFIVFSIITNHNNEIEYDVFVRELYEYVKNNTNAIDVARRAIEIENHAIEHDFISIDDDEYVSIDNYDAIVNAFNA